MRQLQPCGGEMGTISSTRLLKPCGSTDPMQPSLPFRVGVGVESRLLRFRVRVRVRRFQVGGLGVGNSHGWGWEPLTALGLKPLAPYVLARAVDVGSCCQQRVDAGREAGGGNISRLGVGDLSRLGVGGPLKAGGRNLSRLRVGSLSRLGVGTSQGLGLGDRSMLGVGASHASRAGACD